MVDSNITSGRFTPPRHEANNVVGLGLSPTGASNSRPSSSLSGLPIWPRCQERFSPPPLMPQKKRGRAVDRTILRATSSPVRSPQKWSSRGRRPLEMRSLSTAAVRRWSWSLDWGCIQFSLSIRRASPFGNFASRSVVDRADRHPSVGDRGTYSDELHCYRSRAWRNPVHGCGRRQWVLAPLADIPGRR